MPSRRTLLSSIGALAVGALCSIPTRIIQQTNGALNAGDPAPVQPAVAEPAASHAKTEKLVVIPRSAWGAVDPSVSPDGYGEHGPYDAINNPTGWLIYDQPLEVVLDQFIIHHSALPLSDGPREIQRLHMEEKGFADIGYHFLIDEKGSLFEGRSLNVRGAHTYGANEGSLGICLIGNFEEIEPATIQLAIRDKLLVGLVARYPGISRLAGHRDYNPGVTLCPGANLYKRLPDIAKKTGLVYGRK